VTNVTDVRQYTARYRKIKEKQLTQLREKNDVSEKSAQDNTQCNLENARFSFNINPGDHFPGTVKFPTCL